MSPLMRVLLAKRRDRNFTEIYVMINESNGDHLVSLCKLKTLETQVKAK